VPTPLEATVLLQAAKSGGEVEVLPRVFEKVEAGDEQASEVPTHPVFDDLRFKSNHFAEM